MLKKFSLLALLSCGAFISCQKQLAPIPEDNDQTLVLSTDLAQETFAKLLSKATDSDKNVRRFIQSKALEQFDNDYDVFYPFVKDDLLTDGKTFRDILLSYTTVDSLNAIEDALPLLTIYVPELPSGFNAESWEVDEDAPLVAIRTKGGASTPLFSEGSFLDSLSAELIPGFPTLVVKNNERVRITSDIKVKGGKGQYAFLDDAFDKTKNKPATKAIYERDNIANFIPEIHRAYNTFGLDANFWQRDNIYYGLTKTQTSGTPINRRIVESIYALRFTPSALYAMSDQAGDPMLRNELKYEQNSWADQDFNNTRIGNTSHKFWTEGNFEFQIDVMIGNLHGLGTTLDKYFNASARDLYDLTYTSRVVEEIVGGIGKKVKFSVYTVSSIIPKIYRPRIKLVPWDIQNNSFAWKFNISEIDEQTTDIRTQTVTTEFATNFGLNLQKIGLNFGGSAKRSTTNTYSLSVTRGSDQLGSLEIDFSKPVALNTDLVFEGNGPAFYTNLYTVDNPYVSMVLLPVYDY